MFKDCKNTDEQGNIGLGQAIAAFTRLRYVVSIPLNDCQDYDLVVENNGKLLKVQVKTASFKSKHGIYHVDLRVKGGNSGRVLKKFDPTKVDILFVLTDDGTFYLIPTNQISNTSTINLGEKVEQFKFTQGWVSG